MRIIPTLAALCLLMAPSAALAADTPPVLGGQWKEQNDGKGTASFRAGVEIDGKLIAVGDKGAYQISTDHGATFSASPATLSIDGNAVTISPYSFYNIKAVGNRLILVGSPKVLLISDDFGATWKSKIPSTFVANVALRGLAMMTTTSGTVTSTEILTVGSAGAVASSVNNGDLWTKVVPGNTGLYRSVACSTTTFVAVGDGGAIMTRGATATTTNPGTGTGDGGGSGSPTPGSTGSGTLKTLSVDSSKTISAAGDSTTWVKQTAPTVNDLYGVTWTGSTFVAVGAKGTIITSSDGITWTAATVNFSPATAVAFFTDVVSYGSTLMTSGVTQYDGDYLNGFFYSTDGGKTWNPSTTTGFTTGRGVGPMQHLVVGTSGMMAVGLKSEVWYSDGSFEFFIVKSGATATGVKDDPDGDGIINLMEWLLNLNPTVPAAAADRALLPAVTSSGGTTGFVFNLPSTLPTGVTARIERSTDLKTWTSLAKRTGSADWTLQVASTSLTNVDANGMKKTTVNLTAPAFFHLAIDR